MREGGRGGEMGGERGGERERKGGGGERERENTISYIQQQAKKVTSCHHF